jgi:hypothetical protein
MGTLDGSETESVGTDDRPRMENAPSADRAAIFDHHPRMEQAVLTDFNIRPEDTAGADDGAVADPRP